MKSQIRKKDKRIIELENTVEGLESKLRIIEESADTFKHDYEKVYEELTIYKSEKSDSTSPMKMKNDLAAENAEDKAQNTLTEMADQFSYEFSPPKRLSFKKPPRINGMHRISLDAKARDRIPLTASGDINDKQIIYSRMASKDTSSRGGKKTCPGSPTPLKTFLMEHKTRLKHLQEMMPSNRLSRSRITVANVDDSKNFTSMLSRVDNSPVSPVSHVIKNRKEQSVSRQSTHNHFPSPPTPAPKPPMDKKRLIDLFRGKDSRLYRTTIDLQRTQTQSSQNITRPESESPEEHLYSHYRPSLGQVKVPK